MRFMRVCYVRNAVETRADLSPFKARMRPRLFIGVLLVGIGMLLGWPAVACFAGIAVYTGEPLFAVIGGPVVYAVSWGIYGLGILIAGREAFYYVNVFNRWLVRSVVERMIRNSSDDVRANDHCSSKTDSPLDKPESPSEPKEK